MAFSMTVNGQAREFDVEEDTPLLWVLREEAGYTGTKFGCGIGMCGACTLHVDGRAVRSCVTPVGMADGKEVVTIEGLAGSEGLADGALHPLQEAWVEEQVPQCGYCQPGMIMAAAALLKNNSNPSADDIRNGITNICRCGTYPRIMDAITKAAAAKA